MKKKLISITKYSFLIGALIFLVYIFLPREYDVLPYKQLPNTNYWSLSTGSNIGYVLINGKGSKKPYPIIYLHGGPGGAITESTISVLAPFSDEGYDIYAYDQIGSGSSDRLDDIKQYTAERHKSDLEEIVNALGVEKVILLGQSWGSVLATIYIVDNPNKVDKVIMTSPGPVFPINNKVAKLKAPDSLNMKAPAFSNQDANKKAYTFRDKCIRKYAYVFGEKLAPDEQVDDFFTHLNSSLKMSTVFDTSLVDESEGGGGYYAHIMTFQSLFKIDDPRGGMKDMRMPILIMKGQYDNQMWGYTNEYVELLQNATLRVVPNAGHSIYVEQPEIYYREIIGFLME